MGGLKKPLSLKGFNHLSFEPIQLIRWLNIPFYPFLFASWRLGDFSWCKNHPST